MTEDVLPPPRPEALAEEETTRKVIGAFYTVYNALGYGFLEAVYARALAVELSARGIPFEREVSFEVRYRGQLVGLYRADFVVEGRVVVELKAAVHVTKADTRQLLNYLRASGIDVGLLLNFGPEPTLRRVVKVPWRSGAEGEEG